MISVSDAESLLCAAAEVVWAAVELVCVVEDSVLFESLVHALKRMLNDKNAVINK